jgi:cobalt/nickel transport system permease protein
MGQIFYKEMILMHMADTLLSPAVGGTMMAATVGLAAYSVKRIKNGMDEKKIPLMGVMGAFVFATQMINFSILGTGSSGHIGGGLLLGALLGPYAGFLTMAAILLIQALFFGDGGLLAYGSNVFNLGFYTCFIAYPLIFRVFIRKGYSAKRILVASILSAVAGLQLGAFSVVIETLLSGKTELPFKTFLFLMQPIHLIIGIIEGVITASVITFVWKARPEIMEDQTSGGSIQGISTKKVLIVITATAIIISGILSWFASANPDGLEYSIKRITGQTEIQSDNKVNEIFSKIQQNTAFLPDYGFKSSEKDEKIGTTQIESTQNEENTESEEWPNISAGTSFAGIIGSAITLVVTALMGIIISMVKRKKVKQTANH